MGGCRWKVPRVKLRNSSGLQKVASSTSTDEAVQICLTDESDHVVVVAATLDTLGCVAAIPASAPARRHSVEGAPAGHDWAAALAAGCPQLEAAGTPCTLQAGVKVPPPRPHRQGSQHQFRAVAELPGKQRRW